MKQNEIDQRVTWVAEMLHIEHLLGRNAEQLSGGEMQRVAIGRAIVRRPKLFLLDEPLTNLDAKLREAMQFELVGLQKTVGITFVIVTHDQDEALSMADRIAVMDAGLVRQIASPPVLYEFPMNRFVADFIGKMNLFGATVTAAGAGHFDVACPDFGTIRLPGEHQQGTSISLGVRPEKIQILEMPPSDDSICVQARVAQVAYRGSESRGYFSTDNGVRVMVTFPNRHRHFLTLPVGERRWLRWRIEDTLVFGG